MPNTVNNRQSGFNKFTSKLVSEWKKTGSELRDVISGKPCKPSEAGKAYQGSMKARVRVQLENVERMYENKPNKQAALDSIQDQVAFSPEALAMMGA